MSRIVDELRKSGLFPDDPDDETLWHRTTEHFQTLPPTERALAINNVDRMLPEAFTPSREAADVWTKKRQLEDIDFILRRAGR